MVVKIQKKSPSVMEHIPKFNFFSFQEKINDEDICIDFLRKPSLILGRIKVPLQGMLIETNRNCLIQFS